MKRGHVCSRCMKKFESESALKFHIKAKHRSYYFGRSVAPWIALIAVFLITGVYVAPYVAQPQQTQTTTLDKNSLLNMYLKGNEQVSMHIHARLRVLVDGEEIKVPANIGIAADGRMRVIHTHDETGLIHVESPVWMDFTLGDFLAIWGKTISDECFDNYCGKVRVTVNAAEVKDPLNIILRDGDEIIIAISTK
ncbi:MAG: hypothetical protein QW580_05330 [Nitrososphaerota archaeon]